MAGGFGSLTKQVFEHQFGSLWSYEVSGSRLNSCQIVSLKPSRNSVIILCQICVSIWFKATEREREDSAKKLWQPRLSVNVSVLTDSCFEGSMGKII